MVSNPPAQDDPDDRRWMRRVANRDDAALGALYDRYASLVMALCVRVLRDRTMAEDVVEEVFWELWRRADRYNPMRGSVQSYLVTLARSRAIDRLRLERRYRASHLDERLDSDQVFSTLQAADPAETAEAKDDRRRVREALAKLSEEQRQALETAYYDGLSHAQVAEKLNQPMGTVKTHIRQGIIRLRQLLRSSDINGKVDHG